MDEVVFDYSLPPSEVAMARGNERLSLLNSREMRDLFHGRLYVFLECGNKALVIEDRLFDYLIKTKAALTAIREAGAQKISVTTSDLRCCTEYEYISDRKKISIRSIGPGGEMKSCITFSLYFRMFAQCFSRFTAEIQAAIPEWNESEDFWSCVD